MAQYFSMSVSCRKCGFTNKYFYMKKRHDRGGKWSRYEMCMDCWKEMENARCAKYRKTEKYRAMWKRFTQKNRELLNERGRIANRKSREKKRRQRELERLRELNYWKDA